MRWSYLMRPSNKPTAIAPNFCCLSVEMQRDSSRREGWVRARHTRGQRGEWWHLKTRPEAGIPLDLGVSAVAGNPAVVSTVPRHPDIALLTKMRTPTVGRRKKQKLDNRRQLPPSAPPLTLTFFSPHPFFKIFVRLVLPPQQPQE